MFVLKRPEEIKTLALEMKWQYFEKLVGWVFEQNGFDVRVNVTESFGQGRKRQFDVVAEGFRVTFLVECKKWSGKRHKVSLLKKAVKEHRERCGMYAKKHGKDVVPLVVTLTEEDILLHEKIPIIPVDKLNTFINHFEEWI